MYENYLVELISVSFTLYNEILNLTLLYSPFKGKSSFRNKNIIRNKLLYL